MSEINKLYKRYGEYAGQIYATIFCSSLAGLKKLNDENNKEAIPLLRSRVSSYINHKYGVGFLDSYNQFFLEYHGNKKFTAEVTKRHSEFTSKEIIDVIVAPVQHRKSGENTKAPIESAKGITGEQKNPTSDKREVDSSKSGFKENSVGVDKTNPQEGIRNAKAAVFRNPQNARNWCVLGDLYIKAGNWEEAVKSFNKALEKDPKLIDAENGKNFALNKLNAMSYELEDSEKNDKSPVSPVKSSAREDAVVNINLDIQNEESKEGNVDQSNDSTEDEFSSVSGVISTVPEEKKKKKESVITQKEMKQTVYQEPPNATTGVEPGSLTGMAPTDEMRRYGNAFLRLLDEKTRADAYRVIEKIEPKLPEAGVVLGQYYISSNEEEAKRHFKFAANAGIAEGKWGYVSLLPHSYVPIPGDPEDDEWERICLEAAEDECADAAHEMGNICHRRGAIAEAAYWYSISLSLDHVEGTVSVKGIVNEWIENGKPVAYNAGTKNYTNARHRAAITFLRCYVGDNEIEEAKWAFDANPDKMLGYYLGKNYELVKKDYDTSFCIYQRLMEHEYPYAVDRYGMHIFQGRGTTKDFDKGVSYFRKSAEKGCISAAESMGALAKTEKDYLTAAYWYAIGYVRGDEACGGKLVELKDILCIR